MERISKPYSRLQFYHFVAGITQVSIFIYFMDFSNCNLEVVFVRLLSENEILKYCHQELCAVYLYEASHIELKNTYTLSNAVNCYRKLIGINVQLQMGKSIFMRLCFSEARMPYRFPDS